jgi:hypothetical protein
MKKMMMMVVEEFFILKVYFAVSTSTSDPDGH